MSKSSSGSIIGLPTIIFLIFMYNVFFDDDDEDKKAKDTTVGFEVVSEGVPVEPSPDSLGIKESFEEIKYSITIAGKEIKDSLIVIKDELEKEFESEEELPEPIEVEGPPEPIEVVEENIIDDSIDEPVEEIERKL